MKKIDMHCHTTNRKLGNTGECSATLENILRKMKQNDIEKTVVLATYFPHRSSGITNFRLLHWLNNCGGKEKFYLFGSLDFEHYFFQGMNELNELAEAGELSGVKIYTSYQKIDLQSGKFREVVKLARKYQLPMMFHTGYSYMCKRLYGRDCIEGMVRASDLEGVANQGVTVVASHMAKPFFDDVVETCKRNANVYTDVSGLVNSKYDSKDKKKCAKEVKKFVEEVGPSKLLFGTDFPVQTHTDSIYFVEEGMKGFPDSDKFKVYYENARRILENGRKK
jgi:predicted TIM-barrel fold metal-dependent hydrolase